MIEQTHTPFDSWAVVEVMGHNRFAGRVSERVIAGTGFLQVDVPGGPDGAGFTKLLGTNSIYAITPVSEQVARAMAQRGGNRPFHTYELEGIQLSLPLHAERIAAAPDDD